MGNDLGGSDRLAEGQRQLIRRAATLSIMSESVEADFIRNLAFDSGAYGVLCDRLGRCLQSLGLERKSRDVTPSLQSYLQAKGGAMTKGRLDKKQRQDEQRAEARASRVRAGHGRQEVAEGHPRSGQRRSRPSAARGGG